MSRIAGAPELGQPILITGTNAQGVSKALIGQGFGLAAPAYYDWDGDGLKDLLIGEFGSGAEFGRYMGNFIRVYLNEGAETQPVFSGIFSYAKPPFEILSNGTPYSQDQFCCQGFAPQFIDVNNDGYVDIVSGQYYGEVVSFNGSAKGFLAGAPLPQEGNPRDTVRKNFMRNQPYWLYSTASFGDLTADGKPDLVVGGRALRISGNVGTEAEPQFARRELLLDINGQPLRVYEYSYEELAAFEKSYSVFPQYEIQDFFPPYTSGDYELFPFVTDWDGDGVLDLLVTNSYRHQGLSTVDFFRGIKKGDTHRFEPRVPLFTTKNRAKAFPGSHPFLSVTDWNSDGINDLLIGVSVVILHNKFNGAYSWNWEEEMGIMGTARDPGFIKDRNPEDDVEWILKDVVLLSGITREDFMTMRRQGYVYVMLGKKHLPVHKSIEHPNQKSKKK